MATPPPRGAVFQYLRSLVIFGGLCVGSSLVSHQFRFPPQNVRILTKGLYRALGIWGIRMKAISDLRDCFDISKDSLAMRGVNCATRVWNNLEFGV